VSAGQHLQLACKSTDDPGFDMQAVLYININCAGQYTCEYVTVQP
jgi:hypothetical protein